MTKNLKITTGLLLLIGLLATYVACSESMMENNLLVSSDTPAGVMLKSATEGCICETCDTFSIGEKIIYRDPFCTGDCWPYRLLGINFYSGSTGIDTTNLCGSTISTCSDSYHMCFYNEKTLTPGTTTPSGQPLLILDSSKVQAVQVGTGYTDFLSFKCIRDTGSCYNWERDWCFSLPLDINYRITPTCDTTLNKTMVASLAVDKMVIGNDFQGTSDDYGPNYQPVYLLKITERTGVFYYVFMVYQFKNAAPPSTDRFKMTIKYRLLGICSN